ncbi:hypothetical protein KP509_24G033800 [Ceratopteris richardii]|uniref:EF-hand domain-containing protein n=1 Tax=Ceratopteris richardii TaxID=49495 RepID=A0A8T2RTL7_CERRI|nr:hypothetical protein KP509_24G033800 [Ceratopteris richardii]
MLDRDGDGIIRGHDLSAFFDAYVGESLTEEEAASMIAEADSDGDGAVDLLEFQQLTASAENLRSANSFTRTHRAALCRVFNILDADMDGLLGRRWPCLDSPCPSANWTPCLPLLGNQLVPSTFPASAGSWGLS